MADNPSTDSKPAPAEIDKAKADAQTAQARAIDAQARADEAKKSDEQKAADKARADADRARRDAAEKEAALVPTEPMSAAEAMVISPRNVADMSAGDHMAQKFANDPANPQPAKGEHVDPDLCTVKLTRRTSDHPNPVITMVHPDMVGDYLRAGWAKD